MSIENKTALITGISKGIGRALSQQLLEKGCKVIGWGLHAPGFSHENLHYISCDVSSESEVEQARSQTENLFGCPDFIINNAGFGYFSPIENFDTAQWKRMLDVNLTGTFLVTKAFSADMKLRASGHILNISSIAGKSGAAQGEGYNASKYAVTGFSECLFQELRPFGIKVTTVFPGSTQTNFFDAIPGAGPHNNMIQPEDIAATLVHILDSPPNYLIREIEIRPLNSKPPVKGL